MKYEFAADIQLIAEKMINTLFPYVKINRVKCIKSWGTSTRNTIARCHGLGKVFQKAMGMGAFYVLEFISEQFDKLDAQEQEKVILHELMHIPKAFGGGFKHHDFVTESNVELYYKRYQAMRNE